LLFTSRAIGSFGRGSYFLDMPSRQRLLPTGFTWPCLPKQAHTPSSSALWLHEIKHDGFLIIARKKGERVRLYNRPGNDLTDRDDAANRPSTVPAPTAR
jgi:hypothetical protein